MFVVPILPQFLREIELAEQSIHNFETNFKSTNQTQLLNKTETRNSSILTSPEVTVEESSSAKHENISEEGTKFGILLGSKPTVQLVVNPFVGALAYRYVHNSN